MLPVEIKKDIHWVGAVDWNIRDFHGYSTYKGTTYNAFLAVDQKIALIDTVKKPFSGDLVHHLYRVLGDPKKVDYLVVNHVEMDHSGSVPEIVDLVQPEKVVCSPMGKKALLDHYGREDWPYQVVESGATLSLGRKEMRFLETRMLHWPDSMFTYFPAEKLLLSSDAFGQHWSTSERFDDEVDFSELMRHSAKYYANILMLYSPLVQKLLGEVRKMNLEVDMIAPDHGLLWRGFPDRILEAYDRWSRHEVKRKAVVVYDTMWHSTEKMAKAIASGLVREGISVKFMCLKENHRSDVMTEILDAKAVVVGSPTLNNGILPTVADMLCYMKGLKPVNRLGAAFGSYGWSGEAVKEITKALEGMKMEMVEPGFRVKYAPTHEDLKKCVELGEKIAQAVKGHEGA